MTEFVSVIGGTYEGSDGKLIGETKCFNMVLLKDSRVVQVRKENCSLKCDGKDITYFKGLLTEALILDPLTYMNLQQLRQLATQIHIDGARVKFPQYLREHIKVARTSVNYDLNNTSNLSDADVRCVYRFIGENLGMDVSHWSTERAVNVLNMWIEHDSTPRQPLVTCGEFNEGKCIDKSVYPCTFAYNYKWFNKIGASTIFDQREVAQDALKSGSLRLFSTGMTQTAATISNMPGIVVKSIESEFSATKIVFEFLVSLQDQGKIDCVQLFTAPLGWYYMNRGGGERALLLEHCGSTMLSDTLWGIEPEALMHVFAQAARAVHCLRDASLYHGDLFARNVCVTLCGNFKVIDYGMVEQTGNDDIAPIFEFMSFFLSTLRLWSTYNVDARTWITLNIEQLTRSVWINPSNEIMSDLLQVLLADKKTTRELFESNQGMFKWLTIADKGTTSYAILEGLWPKRGILFSLHNLNRVMLNFNTWKSPKIL
jgi:RNase P/RNase MRP subunit p29